MTAYWPRQPKKGSLSWLCSLGSVAHWYLRSTADVHQAIGLGYSHAPNLRFPRHWASSGPAPFARRSKTGQSTLGFKGTDDVPSLDESQSVPSYELMRLLVERVSAKLAHVAELEGLLQQAEKSMNRTENLKGDN